MSEPIAVHDQLAQRHLVVLDWATSNKDIVHNQDMEYYRFLARHFAHTTVICASNTGAAYGVDEARLVLHARPLWPTMPGRQISFNRQAQQIIAADAGVHPPHFLLIRDTLAVARLGPWAHRRWGAGWVLEGRNDYFQQTRLMTTWSPLKRYLMTALTRHYCRRAQRIRSTSQALADRLVREGVPASRIAVWPTLLDLPRPNPDLARRKRTELRQQLNLADEQVMLVSLGLVDEVKGVDLLLDALAALRADVPQLRLVWLGSGQVERFQQRATELGLDQVVHFAGFVPHAEIDGYLAAADGFVLASRGEGRPRAASEAAAAGLPLLLSDVGGNSELAQPGRTGWLFEPTVPAIVEVLREFAQTSASERAEMGTCAADLARNQVDMDVAGPAYLADVFGPLLPG